MANDANDFVRSMGIATSGLRAQAGRMRVISENIANADSTAATAGGDPYRRKVPTFSSALDRTLDAKVVTLGKIRSDQSAFHVKYEPSNPAADATGNVKYPERQSAGRNDRHAGGAAVLRGQSQHHRRHAPDDPAHARYSQRPDRKV